ncbi:OmpA family protein [Flavicella sp.]|uniref:OmpA/MotB family protein n=1 Tax=Flavicella sp. TaxID=2957742 RepID=UPI0026281718|nr:OmpA family protein [Flavicella sp.]MDG1804159.1 OmpA family protein [Flavicella sp.]
MKKLIALSTICVLLLSSCVSKKKYTDLQNANNDTNQELATAKTDLNASSSELEKEQAKNAALEDKIDYLLKGNEKTLEFVDNLTVISKSASENVKETLEQLGKKDEYIKHIQNANSKRDSINLAVAFNLKKVLDDGLNDEDIQVNIEKTVVYISINDKLLFNSGSYTVSNRAKKVLQKVADVINERPEMDVMVEGHTDSRTINTEVLEDNWDLSVKRATSVVRTLQKNYKVAPERLIAAGRSSYAPLVENNSAANRSKNRRTKIIIQPKLDQFLELLEEKN